MEETTCKCKCTSKDCTIEPLNIVIYELGIIILLLALNLLRFDECSGVDETTQG